MRSTPLSQKNDHACSGAHTCTCAPLSRPPLRGQLTAACCRPQQAAPAGSSSARRRGVSGAEALVLCRAPGEEAQHAATGRGQRCWRGKLRPELSPRGGQRSARGVRSGSGPCIIAPAPAAGGPLCLRVSVLPGGCRLGALAASAEGAHRRHRRRRRRQAARSPRPTGSRVRGPRPSPSTSFA